MKIFYGVTLKPMTVVLSKIFTEGPFYKSNITHTRNTVKFLSRKHIMYKWEDNIKI